MNMIHAIILGIVQGLTEFLPISSSAHLEVIPWFFNWKELGLTFDVSLHLGTLIALLAYFWHDWYNMFRAFFASRRMSKNDYINEFPEEVRGDASLIVPIIIACIPAAITGTLFESTLEASVRSHPIYVVAPLMVMGLLLLIADRTAKTVKSMEDVTFWDCIIIGVAQAFALIPGVSRSGVTITAARFCGLKREAAARFSFFLGAPIILGAAAYKLLDVLKNGIPGSEVGAFIAGTLSATVVGYFCIGFLMDYLKKRSLNIFVIYRFALGMVITGVYLYRR
jgi:undecaprenyl-diphosphatase